MTEPAGPNLEYNGATEDDEEAVLRELYGPPNEQGIYGAS